MSLPPPPEGFAIGHWTGAATGCTVILPPAGARAGLDVRGGGPGSRETEIVAPLANPEEATAVVLSGGSAHGLATADGVMRWCEERGRGFRTPGGVVPLVPAAVIYDLPPEAEGGGPPAPRPTAESGYAACEAARGGIPERGLVGAGRGAGVAKALGPEGESPGGIGYAAAVSGAGETVAALAVVNASGDVIDADGGLLAGPRDASGEQRRTYDMIASGAGPEGWGEREATTLACVLTDAALDKVSCAKVARMASAGLARAIDPVFTPFDGDIVFCLASGEAKGDPLTVMRVGSMAAATIAAAVRDAVRQSSASA